MFNLLRIFTFYVKAFNSSQNKFQKQHVDLSELTTSSHLTPPLLLPYWTLGCGQTFSCMPLAERREPAADFPEVFLLVSVMRLAVLLKKTKTSRESIHHLQDTSSRSTQLTTCGLNPRWMSEIFF